METYDLDDDALDDNGVSNGGKPAPTTAPYRSGRRRLALAVVLTLLAILLAGADQYTRGQEFDALLTQVERGQSTIVYADRRVAAMVQYTSPQLFYVGGPVTLRASLRAIVQQAAAQQVAPLQARRQSIAQLRIAPWHRGQRAARKAYLAYLDYRIDYLRAIAKNLQTLYQPQPQNARLLAAARRALLDVAPSLRSSDQVRSLLAG